MLRKEKNRLLSKGMSDIYLKVAIEKKLPFSKHRFLSLSFFSLGQFLDSSNSCRHH